MEFDEEKELAFLNAMTSRNRRNPCCHRGKPKRFPFASGFLWISGTALMILLAHMGAIPGWLMHLTTEILTFHFALELGRFLTQERRMKHV